MFQIYNFFACLLALKMPELCFDGILDFVVAFTLYLATDLSSIITKKCIRKAFPPLFPKKLLKIMRPKLWTWTKLDLYFHIYESIASEVVSSVYFPLSLPVASARPLALRSMINFLSLSIFNFTIDTLEG